MAEAVRGNKIVYLFRVYGQTYAAKVLAFTTENGRSVSKSADSTATKDGPIRTPGNLEQEITANAILKVSDGTVDEFEDAMKDDQLFEIWEANLEEPGTGANKFKGMYFQGYCTDISKTSSAEDFCSVDFTFGVNGKGERGDVTVTAEQQEAAEYVFTDTVAKA